MIYSIIFIYLIIKSYLVELGVKKSNLISPIYIIYLNFVLCFFYTNGYDWTEYQRFFEETNFKNFFLENSSSFEIGYVYLNFIFQKFLNYELFNGLILICCLLIILKKLKRYSQNLPLALLIYLVIYLFENFMQPGIRQLIAIIIILLGLKYIEEKKFFKYLLIVILSMLFHKTSLIMLSLYLLEKINMTKMRVLISFVILELFFKNINYLLRAVLSSTKYLSKYLYYLDSEVYSKVVERSSINQLVALITLGFYLFIIFYSYDLLKNKQNYIKNAAIFCVLMTYFSNKFVILFRIVDYYEFFLACSLSSIGLIPRVDRKIKLIILTFLLAINCGKFYKNSLTGIGSEYYPWTNYIIEYVNGKTYEEYKEKINYRLNKFEERKLKINNNK